MIQIECNGVAAPDGLAAELGSKLAEFLPSQRVSLVLTMAAGAVRADAMTTVHGCVVRGRSRGAAVSDCARAAVAQLLQKYLIYRSWLESAGDAPAVPGTLTRARRENFMEAPEVRNSGLRRMDHSRAFVEHQLSGDAVFVYIDSASGLPCAAGRSEDGRIEITTMMIP